MVWMVKSLDRDADESAFREARGSRCDPRCFLGPFLFPSGGRKRQDAPFDFAQGRLEAVTARPKRLRRCTLMANDLGCFDGSRSEDPAPAHLELMAHSFELKALTADRSKRCRYRKAIDRDPPCGGILIFFRSTHPPFSEEFDVCASRHHPHAHFDTRRHHSLWTNLASSVAVPLNSVSRQRSGAGYRRP